MRTPGSRSALIVVDLMPRLVELDLPPHPGVDVVARAARLADTWRRAGETVVLVLVLVERPGLTGPATLRLQPPETVGGPPRFRRGSARPSPPPDLARSATRNGGRSTKIWEEGAASIDRSIGWERAATRGRRDR
ncbi:MAG TPA: hypothetical protein VN408_42530 [Actinoplanes sp.]|nr:hypothetical protein [Actinoplanes sp.]